MSKISIVIMITGLVMISSPLWAQKDLNNTFYAQNTFDGMKNAPQTAREKAKFLKSIGYDGLEGMGYRNFFELKNALDQENLLMPANYVELNFEAGEKLKSTSADEIKAMIRASAKGSVIYFHLHSNSYANDKESGDQVVTVMLRELSDYAAPFGVNMCVYPHVTLYCETVSHSVRLCRLVDRKNFGAAMNLCHLLKVEGSEGIDAKVAEFAPYLFAVNICGADDGDTRNFNWDRLIQPLGEGSFDTYRFVKSLRDNGYTGPIGLQCYNLKGDALKTLTRSLEIWKSYKNSYTEDKK
ncbi:MAG: sugar phosphate isomerase/epimerase [Bacteroidia bacterium]|nr:sugar phosphate isomerase/epimerase [Bacteroidia bacterium]